MDVVIMSLRRSKGLKLWWIWEITEEQEFPKGRVWDTSDMSSRRAEETVHPHVKLTNGALGPLKAKLFEI